MYIILLFRAIHVPDTGIRRYRITRVTPQILAAKSLSSGSTEYESIYFCITFTKCCACCFNPFGLMASFVYCVALLESL